MLEDLKKAKKANETQNKRKTLVIIFNTRKKLIFFSFAKKTFLSPKEFATNKKKKLM